MQHVPSFASHCFPISVEEEFVLDGPTSIDTNSATPTQSQDFGHSLLGGYSDTYQPDLVLQATSAPLSQFKDKLITDMATLVKVWPTNTSHQ